ALPILVTHSMGGLVVRDAIKRCLAHDNNCVRMLTTLSTPFDGIEFARVGVTMSPSLVPAWLDIMPSSEFLTTLFDFALPNELQHHLGFSFDGGGDDGVVTVKSQLRSDAQQGATSMRGFFADHVGILHNDEVAAWLRKLLAEAAGRITQK